MYFIYDDHFTVCLPRLPSFYKPFTTSSYFIKLHHSGTHLVCKCSRPFTWALHARKWTCPCLTFIFQSVCYRFIYIYAYIHIRIHIHRYTYKYYNKETSYKKSEASVVSSIPTTSKTNTIQDFQPANQKFWAPSRASHMKTHQFIATWGFSECKSATSRMITGDASPNHHYHPPTLMVWQHRNSPSRRNLPGTDHMTW